MKISSGLAIKYKNSLLVVHPKNASWEKSYSIPKGHVEKNESFKDAAIRETFEEVGIFIEKHMIDSDGPIINYRDKKGKIYKRVYWFLVEIKDLKEIGLFTEIVPNEQLQKEEVDWAGFIDAKDLENKMNKKLLPIASYLQLI